MQMGRQNVYVLSHNFPADSEGCTPGGESPEEAYAALVSRTKKQTALFALSTNCHLPVPSCYNNHRKRGTSPILCRSMANGDRVELRLLTNPTLCRSPNGPTLSSGSLDPPTKQYLIHRVVITHSCRSSPSTKIRPRSYRAHRPKARTKLGGR